MHLKKIYTVILCFFLLGQTVSAQVGINIATNDPKTTLDVGGAISLASSTITLTKPNNYNIVVGDFSLVNIVGPNADFNINTIKPAIGADGQIVTFVNTTNHTMKVLHNSGVSINSVYCPYGTAIILSGMYSTVSMQYNETQKRWIVLKYSSEKQDYEDIIYSSIGTTDTETNSENFTPLADMSYTFTPKNDVVYVNVSVSGNMEGSGNIHGFADLRLMNLTTNQVIAGATALASDNSYNAVTTSWNIRMVMVPVTVTPGQPTDIEVQWRCGGGSPITLHCKADTGSLLSHRNIAIVD